MYGSRTVPVVFLDTPLQQLDRFLGGMELAAAADICLGPDDAAPRVGEAPRRGAEVRPGQLDVRERIEVIPPRLSQMSQAALSGSRDA